MNTRQLIIFDQTNSIHKLRRIAVLCGENKDNANKMGRGEVLTFIKGATQTLDDTELRSLFTD